MRDEFGVEVTVVHVDDVPGYRKRVLKRRRRLVPQQDDEGDLREVLLEGGEAKMDWRSGRFTTRRGT